MCFESPYLQGTGWLPPPTPHWILDISPVESWHFKSHLPPSVKLWNFTPISQTTIEESGKWITKVNFKLSNEMWKLSELINMTWACIWVPDWNWTHHLPNNGVREAFRRSWVQFLLGSQIFLCSTLVSCWTVYFKADFQSVVRILESLFMFFVLLHVRHHKM